MRLRKSPGNKFSAKKAECDGIIFHSRGEMRRYQDLKDLLLFDKISDLKLQVPFKIVVNNVYIGEYHCDFLYIEDGKKIIEDFKGVQTPFFKWKWKLMQALFPEYHYRITTKTIIGKRK